MLAHDGLELVRGDGVEADEGLIHYNELRLVYERRDERQLLLHAVGVGGHRLGEVVGQLEEVGVFVYPLVARVGRHAVDVRDEVEVFDAGEEVVEVRVIRDVGDVPFALQRLGLDALAADVYLSGVELEYAAAGLDGSGLAGAVVADEAVDLPRLYVQRKVVHGLLLAVGLCEVFYPEHGV